jgi:prolyl 4-hydroxylase
METKFEGLTINRLMEHPSLYLIDDFISKDECQWFIDNGKNLLQKATVIDAVNGGRKTSDHRDSSTYFFPLQSSDVIRSVENKITSFTTIPVQNGEDFQLAHYGVGEYYQPHFDWHDPDYEGTKALLEQNGQRHATVLIYLNKVEKGGNTSFPKIGLEIVPRPGRAVIWYNCFWDGNVDHNTLHGAEPVEAGEKYIITKWMHLQEYIK